MGSQRHRKQEGVDREGGLQRGEGEGRGRRREDKGKRSLKGADELRKGMGDGGAADRQDKVKGRAIGVRCGVKTDDK